MTQSLQRLDLLQLLRSFEPLELGGAGFGADIVLSELYEVISPQACLKDDDGLVAAAALHPLGNTIHADRQRFAAARERPFRPGGTSMWAMMPLWP
jgi:hypothetical protein